MVTRLESLCWPATQPTLTAGDLVLRPWRDSDADAVVRACQEPAIQRYTRVPEPYLLSDAEEFVGSGTREAWRVGAGAAFAIASIESGDVVGAVGLMDVDAVRRVASAGYWMAAAARRRGVASRALGAITEWALTDVGFVRLEVEIEPENTASLGVAAAAGFVRDDITGLRRASIKGRDREFVVLFRGEPVPA